MTSYLTSSITDFIDASINEILGKLSKGQSEDTHQTLERKQTSSWIEEIKILKEVLSGIPTLSPNSSILLEYFIPRRGKRIDAVILTNNIIVVLEFKISSLFKNNADYSRHDLEQCEDYALDLRDFHKESANKVIVPVLIDTSVSQTKMFREIGDQVKATLAVNSPKSLTKVISDSIERYGSSNHIDVVKWDSSVYEPTPTIIEAAQRLYSSHGVRDITTAGADRYNLTNTTNSVLSAINYARQQSKKVVIFVTGVPGSGKTLVGLNIAHDEGIISMGYNASFLSGNYPLVTVLREALASDKAKRENISKKEALREASTKVQHVLDFKKHYYKEDKQKPNEHIIIFDEARRAWNQAQMLKKSTNQDKPYTMSEPELIIDIMDRHTDWAVIIGLVGTGQEIHNGEAGLREWGNTVRKKHKNWIIFTSPQTIGNGQLAENQTLFNSVPETLIVKQESTLHLRTSIRSYKAAMLSDWVNAVLINDPKLAREIFSQIRDYPVLVTRSFEKAKLFIKQHCRGTRNAGVVASSGAKRLRPLGIETELELDVAKWFLSDKNDVRSSSFLELPATEFDIQGLERDWICLAWDQDLTRNKHDWIFRDFCGSKWKYLKDELKKEYLLNSYRVLMTRGREGLVIFIPSGDTEDTTRSPELYDSINSYLIEAGVIELK